MNHIKYEEGTSWCGQTLDSSFHFKDIEQATINNFHGERKVCPHCIAVIINALMKVPEVAQLTEDAQSSTLDGYGGNL